MRKAVAVLLLISYLWLIADGLLGPLYAVFSEKVADASVLETAGAYAAFLIVGGVLHLVCGKVADKTKKAKRMMLGGYVLAAISTFGYVFVNDILGLFIVQSMLGVANAMSSCTWEGIFSKTIKNDNAVTMWSLVDGGYSLISGASVIVGGVLVTLFSFEVLFIVMGSIFVFASILIYFVQEVQRSPYG